VTVILLVEGDTERALKEHLKDFLDEQATREGKSRYRLSTRTKIETKPVKLRKQVELELSSPGVTAVVALVDVFPDYASAADAKQQLRDAVGDVPQFFAHAAQHDVEAWVLPYWDSICARVGVRQRRPGAHPEAVDGEKPPAYHLRELYQRAHPKPRKYSKPIEMKAILAGKDLTVAAAACPEFKAFLNTLLSLGGLTPLP
jgi:hypothetical protein